jgi:hypothetical protein
MESVTPGEPGYADAYARIARILQEDEEERGAIREMSEQSFRLWLHDAVDRIALALGWSAGAALAAIKDYLAIASNARQSLADGYRAGLAEARQVRRRKRTQ